VEELGEQAVDVGGLVGAVVGDVQLDQLGGDVVVRGHQHLDLMRVHRGIVGEDIRGGGHGLQDIHLVVGVERGEFVHPGDAHHGDGSLLRQGEREVRWRCVWGREGTLAAKIAMR
jgi:hypothetical protein